MDTRTKNKDLTNKFISDLVLQILSYVAQTERENIKSRQEQGIIQAKKKGVKFGRPPKKKPENFEHVRQLWKNKEISSRQEARMLSISQDTFLRWSRESLKTEEEEIFHLIKKKAYFKVLNEKQKLLVVRGRMVGTGRYVKVQRDFGKKIFAEAV